MKLAHLLERYKADIKAVLKHYNVNLADPKQDHGKTGLRIMWNALHVARRLRAYGTADPAAPRDIPVDGSEYAEYYANGANDEHVATLLRRIKADILAGK